MTNPLPSTTILLRSKIKRLNEILWSNRCRSPQVDAWLRNFDGSVIQADVEQAHALHLLSRLSYFGDVEVRQLLKSLYRDQFRYHVMSELRQARGMTRDLGELERAYQGELDATRFLGMGNPAESGTHLLYYFRQENGLPKRYFVSEHQLLDRSFRDRSVKLDPPNLRRLVFIDDVCATGQQCVDYSQKLLAGLKDVAANEGRAVEFTYLVMFATSDAIANVRQNTLFDSVNAVHVFDEHYKCFDPQGPTYSSPPAGISLATGEQVAREYGMRLVPNHSLGYNDSQLLLAFAYNTPDNTLPIMWYEKSSVEWAPIVPRYPKV